MGFLRNQAITSAPALAAAIRETHFREFATSTAQFCAPQRNLVQMYRVLAGETLKEANLAHGAPGSQAWVQDVADEAHSAATVAGDVAERLRRLSGAYGEWKNFDAPAYFDIPQPQADLLLNISERVSSVYIHFQMDLLLPSFGVAESYWANHFAPAYHAANIAQIGQTDPADDSGRHHFNRQRESEGGRGGLGGGTGVTALSNNNDDPFVEDFLAAVQPTMLLHWQRLMAVIQKTRQILADDIGYLTTNGGEDERSRYDHHWRRDPAPGLAAELLPALDHIPTLSLTFTFPLPVHRQSGRLRRLRTNREHSRRWRRK